jgi:hypothetical protein
MHTYFSLKIDTHNLFLKKWELINRIFFGPVPNSKYGVPGFPTPTSHAFSRLYAIRVIPLFFFSKNSGMV